MLQYDEYKKKAPKGKSIPEAIYKTGVCFQELGMKDEAKVFYQEITAKFPKSEFAKKAQIRLKSI
jgi:TolA-binding protein